LTLAQATQPIKLTICGGLSKYHQTFLTMKPHSFIALVEPNTYGGGHNLDTK
jgi:hypothetical protein